MKKIILIFGIVLLLMGVFQGGRYFLDYEVLSEYGKGFVWGSAILFLIGIVLIYLGLKKNKNSL